MDVAIAEKNCCSPSSPASCRALISAFFLHWASRTPSSSFSFSSRASAIAVNTECAAACSRSRQLWAITLLCISQSSRRLRSSLSAASSRCFASSVFPSLRRLAAAASCSTTLIFSDISCTSWCRKDIFSSTNWILASKLASIRLHVSRLKMRAASIHCLASSHLKLYRSISVRSERRMLSIDSVAVVEQINAFRLSKLIFSSSLTRLLATASSAFR
mmetsp:Transcript_121232/g.209496  ORF Transcript_121232/g.209496 Transcript_121232/m.209496 type:complete len:217 (+) Transcript_121232:362-1012(+)